MKLPSAKAQLAAVKLAGVVLREAIGIAGMAMVFFGLSAIYPPAAWIVGGLACIGWAYLMARKAD